MSDPLIRLRAPRQVPRSDTFVPLGRRLVSSGVITHVDLFAALRRQRQWDAPLGEILVAQGKLSHADLYAALAEQANADFVTLTPGPLTPR